MNTLYIDTSNNKKTIIKLKKENVEFVLEEERQSSQTTLPLIEKILKEAKIRPDEIDEIKVNKGPGSFTGLRVGISIANALSFGLLRKVNDKKIGEIETPIY